jgi:hypothetical protein
MRELWLPGGLPGVVTPVSTLSLINYHIIRIKHYTQAQRRMLSLSLSNFFFFSFFPFSSFFLMDYIKFCLLLTVNYWIWRCFWAGQDPASDPDYFVWLMFATTINRMKDLLNKNWSGSNWRLGKIKFSLFFILSIFIYTSDCNWTTSSVIHLTLYTLYSRKVAFLRCRTDLAVGFSYSIDIDN